MKKSEKVVYKEYMQGQPMLPPSIEEIIPEKHMVRVISRVVDCPYLRLISRMLRFSGSQ